MSIDDRVAQLQRIKPGDFALDTLAAMLLQSFRASMVQLTGDPNRDIIGFDAETVGNDREIQGRSSEDLLRLRLIVRSSGNTDIDVTVLAAKGAIEVTAEALGEFGAEYGNRVHVARGFDILLEQAIRGGVTTLVGRPVDDRVRALYVLMGFAKGEVLDLQDGPALERAVTWLDQQYEDAALEHTGFERPW